MDSGIRKEKRESGVSPERTRHCNRERCAQCHWVKSREGAQRGDLKSGDLLKLFFPAAVISLWGLDDWSICRTAVGLSFFGQPQN